MSSSSSASQNCTSVLYEKKCGNVKILPDHTMRTCVARPRSHYKNHELVWMLQNTTTMHQIIYSKFLDAWYMSPFSPSLGHQNGDSMPTYSKRPSNKHLSSFVLPIEVTYEFYHATKKDQKSYNTITLKMGLWRWCLPASQEHYKEEEKDWMRISETQKAEPIIKCHLAFRVAKKFE
jgi:hypothetical protein